MSFEDFKDQNTSQDSGEKNLSEKNDSKKISGIVIIVTENGFGFIKCKERDKLFFHFNEVDNKNLIEVNTEVEFEIGKGKDGRDAAQKVEILSKQTSTQESSTENQEEVKMPEYFLPSDTKSLIKPGEVENFALRFHKYAKFNKDKFKFYSTERYNDFNDVKNIDFSKIDLKKIRKENEIIVESLYGKNNFKEFKLDIDWRMVVGLGTESVYETSMTLHPIYGIPYIPGQAVKGITRSWFIREYIMDEKDHNETSKEAGDKIEQKAYKNETFCRMFGCPKESILEKEHKGSIVFFDAFPISSPNLKVDVMNPHYGPYYNDTDGKTPPADYHNPIPIYFLTVEKTSFQFLIGIKDKDYSEVKVDKLGSGSLLSIAEDQLKQALQNQGIGAKSAVGYGYFNEIK